MDENLRFLRALAKIFPLSFLLAPTLALCLTGEVVIIQTRAHSGKTFIIGKGRADGILPGLVAIFSNGQLAVKAQAIEVNRFHSLWETQKGVAPFAKDEFVYFNRDLKKIHDLLSARDPKETYHHIHFEGRWFLALKTSLSVMVGQGVSGKTAHQKVTRQGHGFEAHYLRTFAPHWQWGVGVRLDRDNQQIQDLRLKIPSSRFMAQGQLGFFLKDLRGGGASPYAIVEMGVGQSSSKVAYTQASGTALLLPGVRVGYQFSPKNLGALLELAFESVHLEETFSNGDQVNTTLVNLKVAGGFRF